MPLNGQRTEWIKVANTGGLARKDIILVDGWRGSHMETRSNQRCHVGICFGSFLVGSGLVVPIACQVLIFTNVMCYSAIKRLLCGSKKRILTAFDK